MLEKILSRLGKLFILGAVLGAGEVNSSKAYAQNVPEKKVLFYMQSKDFNGNIKREFEPGENFNLEIYADNRALEGEKTGVVLWDIISTLNMTGITPIKHYGNNDFFYPLTTEEDDIIKQGGRKISGIWTNKRAAEQKIIPYKRDGVDNKVGLLAVYSVSINPTNSIGQYIMQMGNVLVGSDNTETRNEVKQPYKVKNFSVAVRKKNSVEPVVALTSDAFRDYLVYVAGSDDRNYKLEVSDNLKDWTAVWTNSSTGSFLYEDKEAALKENRFYRAVESDE